MSKQTIEVPVLSPGVRDVGVPLSLVTKANGFVFVSGTPPFDLETGKFVRGDIEVQTEASLKAVQHCLESAGTSLDKVVMVRVYASNAGFHQTINRIYARFFPKNPLSRTFVPVASWPTEFDIEIECVAMA
ncbi:enamine deaminase RidA [Microvirga ossetica]|uniref:Enamine deaminase RidA n=1 Tax=Microvirga ossetica TaxID=1882682 RepID=A0A1B2EGA5_9HYPH|nr:RidA family protein [Microvirga ossetica]ANY78892.1 enamine deaminase RidA [Microvirga ossetica]